MIKAENLIPIIDQNTEDYLDLIKPLSDEQLNWKPSANQWSVGQCLDHIIVSNKVYWPVLTSLADGTYVNKNWVAKIPYWPRLAGRILKVFIEPSRRKRTKTIPVFEPSQSEIHLDLLDEFVAQQNEMKALMTKIVGRPNIAQQLVTSPASKAFVFSVADMMEVLVLHEQRHLAQVREVLTMRESI